MDNSWFIKQLRKHPQRDKIAALAKRDDTPQILHSACEFLRTGSSDLPQSALDKARRYHQKNNS